MGDRGVALCNVCVLLQVRNRLSGNRLSAILNLHICICKGGGPARFDAIKLGNKHIHCISKQFASLFLQSPVMEFV